MSLEELAFLSDNEGGTEDVPMQPGTCEDDAMLPAGLASGSSTDAPSASAGGASENSSEAAAATVKLCTSCGVALGSPDIINMGEETGWALPNNRGAWCANCHGCWRTNHGATCSQTVLLSKCEQSPPARTEWDMEQAVWLSLKREGLPQVTKEMCRLRREAFAWMCRVLGMPTSPSVVVPIKCFSDPNSSWYQKPFDPSQLVTLDDGGVSRLCVFMEQHRQEFLVDSVLRPTCPDGQRLLRDRLRTMSRDDKLALAAIFGGSAAADADAAVSSALVAVVTNPMEMTDRLLSKITVYCDKARSLLDPFCRTTWRTEMKEQTFTQPLTRLNALNNEATTAGRADCIRVLKPVIAVFQGSKAFFKIYCQLEKVKAADLFVKKHTELRPLLDKLLEFLLLANAKATPELRLLQARAHVLSAAARDSFAVTTGQLHALGTPLHDVNELGLGEALNQRSNETESFDPRVWLQETAIKVLETYLKAIPACVWERDDVRTLLASEFDQCKRALNVTTAMLTADEEMVRSADIEALPAALSLLFRAAAPDAKVSPRDVHDAFEFLKDRKVAQITKMLRSVSVVNDILDLSARWLQRHASDTLGDSRLEAASAFMDSLPALEDKEATEDGSGAETMLTRLDLLTDMRHVTVLVESAAAVVEAFTNMSEFRMEEQVDNFKSWFDKAGQCLLTADLALSARLGSAVGTFVLADAAAMDPKAGEEDEDDDEDAADSKLKKVKVLRQASFSAQQHLITEGTHVTSLAENLAGNLFQPLTDAVPELATPLNDFLEIATMVSDRSLVRNTVQHVLTALNKVLTGHVAHCCTPEGCVHDYRSHCRAGSPAQSFLASLMGLAEAACALDKKKAFEWLLNQECYRLADPLMGTLKVSNKVVNEMCVNLLSSFSVETLLGLAKSSVQSIVKELSEGLGLDAMIVPTAVAPMKENTSTDLGVCLGDVLDAKKLEPKGFVQEFSEHVQGADGLVNTPGHILYALLKPVYERGAADVDVSCFVKGDEVSATHLDLAMRVFLELYSINGLLTYLGSCYFSRPQLVVSTNHVLAPEARKAVRWLGDSLQTMFALLADETFDQITFSDALPFDLKSLKSWGVAVQALHEATRDKFMGLLVADIDAFATVLKDRNPPYSSYLSGDTYIASKCKSYILQNTHRQAIAAGCKELKDMLASAEDTFKVLFPAQTVPLDVVYQDMKNAQNVFTQSKLLVKLTACLHVVLELSSDKKSQQAMASKIVEGDTSTVPSGLLKALEGLARAGPAVASPAAKRAKNK